MLLDPSFPCVNEKHIADKILAFVSNLKRPWYYTVSIGVFSIYYSTRKIFSESQAFQDNVCENVSGKRQENVNFLRPTISFPGKRTDMMGNENSK